MSVKGDKMKGRLLDQFTVSTRLLDLLDVINNRFDDSDAILDYLLYFRFLDTASGVWLDGIGVLVGVSRPYVDRDDIFTYKAVGEADDTTLAYGTVAGGTGGAYTSVNGSPTGELVDDETYRALIKAKIFATYAYPNLTNIYLFIKYAFGVESKVRAPRPMAVEVELATTLTNVERRLLVQYAPLAGGREISIINWP